jgi:thymidylate kinase
VILIEIIGIPGSGKSTLFSLFKSGLSDQNLIVYDSEEIFLKHEELIYPGYIIEKIRKIPSSYRFYFLRILNKIFKIEASYIRKFNKKNPELIEFVFDLIKKKHIFKKHKKYLNKWTQYLFSVYEIASNFLNDKSVLLFDEGFSQKAITYFNSVYERNLNIEEFEKYIHLIPKIDIIIRLNSDKSICYERIVKRGLPKRLEEGSSEEIGNYFDRSVVYIEKACKMLEKQGSHIIEVENSENSSNLENIHVSIDRLLTEILGLDIFK